MPSAPPPGHSFPVYRADHLRVVNGANEGDPLSIADEVVLDDVYALSQLASEAVLRIEVGARPPFRVAAGSDLGCPGAAVYLDCCLTFMAGNGATTDVLVFVETGPADHVEAVYALPLAPMASKQDYVLVGVERDEALAKFAQMACVSFTAGTPITLATGAQRPVEALNVGDRVLTRDNGPQELRWIGRTTVRAVGAFAPILIRKGVLNNATEMLVSPEHRLFVYQREDRLGAGRAEVLVKARHLVNGTTVLARPGGFVEYFQLLFDHHQIIYAAGIAAESMLVDSRTSALLSEEAGARLAKLLPGHRASDHGVFEPSEGLLARPDIADLLRRASLG